VINPNLQVVDPKTGRLTRDGVLLLQDINVLPVYTVDTLPSAARPAQLIFVSDETGGATVAFSDGSAFRRVQDRAVVS
jgi:hypothetical protein